MGKKQSIEDLLNQLRIHSGNEEHELVLECASNILHQSPSDKDSQHSKIVALIKLDRFNEALKFFESDSNLSEDYPTEYAYVLYKTDNFETLFSKFDSSSNERGILHTLAQARYRQENLNTAEEIYKKFSSKGVLSSNEQSDLSVNQAAVSALRALISSSAGLSTSSSSSIDYTSTHSSIESYDQLFNIATTYIGSGQYSKALELLRDAKLACENSPYLSTPQDVSEEIAPILVQAAYVNYLLGNKEESLSILEEAVGIQALPAGLVKLISTNNLLALKLKSTDNNEPEILSSANKSLLELDQSTGNPNELDQRIIRLQKSFLSYNKLVLQTKSGRDVSKSASKFIKQNPSIVGIKSLSVLSKTSEDDDSASANVEKSKIKKLRQLFLQSPSSLPIALALTQIYIKSENIDSAAEVLETVFKARKSENNQTEIYLPGLVGALVSIFSLQNRTKAALDLIAEAFQSWKSNSSTLNIPAFVLAQSNIPEYRYLASDYFKAGLSLVPESKSLAAGLLSTGNKESVDNYQHIISTSGLPSISDIVRKSNIDAQALSDAGVVHLLKRRADPLSSVTKKRKTTSKRRSKLPKDYDENKQPDPERWLPKRDRSTWRPKRKDKRNAAKTQGGVVDNTTESGIQQQQQTSVVQSKSASAAKNKKKKTKSKR